MYKDVVIKKRVWLPEDNIEFELYELFGHDEPIQVEIINVDFNGRIPIDNAVTVGDWITNGYQLIKANYAEIIGSGDRVTTEEQINKLIDSLEIVSGDLLPTKIYYCGDDFYALEFSNGERTASINIDWFQYIYEGNYQYDLFFQPEYENIGGLVLKQNGLVCGFVMGMNTNINRVKPIWKRPYSSDDYHALNTIQG